MILETRGGGSSNRPLYTACYMAIEAIMQGPMPMNVEAIPIESPVYMAEYRAIHE